MIDDKLSELLDKLLEVSIEWLKVNGYDNVDAIHFSADGLKEGMKYGKGCPCIDNNIAILDEKRNILGEYL